MRLFTQKLCLKRKKWSCFFFKIWSLNWDWWENPFLFWKSLFVEKSGPQIWLCLFTFRPIASKKLNGLTTIDTLSWLGGAVVKHPLCVQVVPGSIFSKGFYVLFFVLLLCFYFIFGKNTLFITKVCNSFTILIHWVYLRYCKIYGR